MTFVIAHRGASADAPENTLAAFRLAFEQGADGIEGDFRLSSDGRIVCLHDDDLARVAGSQRVVRETTFADLQQFDIGRWKGKRWRGERIVSLEEVLEVVPAGKWLVMELKAGPEIVAPLADVLDQATIARQQVLVISLVDATFAECKRRLPALPCHWLSGYAQRADGDWSPNAEEVVVKIRQLGANGFGSESRPECFNAAFVQRLRSAGISEFHVWTVDDPEAARLYASLGAWGITTNRPALIRSAMR